MLTRTLRLNGTTIDPAEAVRSARDIQAPDPREFLKAFDDMPEKLEGAIDAAGTSLRDAGESLRATVHELSAPPRRNRMPAAGGWVAGLVVMVAAVALTTWLVRRLWPATKATPDDEFAQLDRLDLDRAAGEGMGTAPGAVERRSSLPTTGEGLLAPLDSRRQTTEPDLLTGVMAEPTGVGADSYGGVGSEVSGAASASGNGVGATSDRYAG
jgi:hypothetical protein